MLARAGPLPTRPGWSFEPKWDGFRAIVRTGSDYVVRSRRGRNMTELLPEFASLPVRGVFDRELVAFGNDRKPSFRQVCRRMLERDVSVPVTLVVFDVLELDGETTPRLPFESLRRLLRQESPTALRSWAAPNIGPEGRPARTPQSPEVPARSSKRWEETGSV